jgi:hypothetical protein
MSVIKVNTIQNANGTTGITFAANGQMTLANTPLQLTGGQIKFPSTKIASADGNTLDDYEEGTWTPTFPNIGTGTYTQQFGRYTKVGRLVTIECYLVINAIGSASGLLTIAGLPFGCINTVATPQMWTNNWASSGQNVVGLISSFTQIDLFSIPASSGVTQLTMSALTNNSNLVFNFSYSIL